MELAQPPGTGERGRLGMAAEYRGGPGKIGWSVVDLSGFGRMDVSWCSTTVWPLIIDNYCVCIFLEKQHV